jgi:hypothetical protein
MLKEKLPFDLINTLLLHIPLSALTHGQNDGQRIELILVGLGNLRFLQVNQGIFLIRTKLSNTAYLFLALYGSTT